MSNSGARKQLEDAVALLTMLEQLVSGCEKEAASGNRLIWRGIRLSIHQSRQLVLQAVSSESSSPAVLPSRQSSSERSAEQLAEGSAGVTSSASSGTIAGRITKAPTTRGRVRELSLGEEQNTSIVESSSGEPSRSEVPVAKVRA